MCVCALPVCVITTLLFAAAGQGQSYKNSLQNYVQGKGWKRPRYDAVAQSQPNGSI